MKSRFLKGLIIIVVGIISITTLYNGVELFLKHTRDYAYIEYGEDDGPLYFIRYNENRYVELPHHYSIYGSYDEKPLAILTDGSYISSNLSKSYIYGYPNDENQDYIFADSFWDSIVSGGDCVKEGYDIPEVKAENIASINVYSYENSELVFSVDSTEGIKGILERGKYDFLDGYYFYERSDNDQISYYIDALFNDGLLTYDLGEISEQTLKEWKELYA